MVKYRGVRHPLPERRPRARVGQTSTISLALYYPLRHYAYLNFVLCFDSNLLH